MAAIATKKKKPTLEEQQATETWKRVHEASEAVLLPDRLRAEAETALAQRVRDADAVTRAATPIAVHIQCNQIIATFSHSSPDHVLRQHVESAIAQTIVRFTRWREQIVAEAKFRARYPERVPADPAPTAEKVAAELRDFRLRRSRRGLAAVMRARSQTRRFAR
jgi:hypothetical protein